MYQYGILYLLLTVSYAAYRNLDLPAGCSIQGSRYPRESVTLVLYSYGVEERDCERLLLLATHTPAMSKHFVILRGGTGMGKSTLADRFEQERGATVCSNDRFYRRGAPGFRTPGGEGRHADTFEWRTHLDHAIPWSEGRCEEALDRGDRCVILDNWNLCAERFSHHMHHAVTAGYTVVLVSVLPPDITAAEQGVRRNPRSLCEAEYRRRAERALNCFNALEEKPDGAIELEFVGPLMGPHTYESICAVLDGHGHLPPSPSTARSRKWLT